MTSDEILLSALERIERRLMALEHMVKGLRARKALGGQGVGRPRAKGRLATGAKALQLKARPLEPQLVRVLTPEEHALKCQELERKRVLKQLRPPKTSEQLVRELEAREYAHAGPARRREIREARRARYLRAQVREERAAASLAPLPKVLDDDGWSMERITEPQRDGCAREEEGAQERTGGMRAPEPLGDQ